MNPWIIEFDVIVDDFPLIQDELLHYFYWKLYFSLRVVH